MERVEENEWVFWFSYTILETKSKRKKTDETNSLQELFKKSRNIQKIISPANSSQQESPEGNVRCENNQYHDYQLLLKNSLI